MIFNSACQLQAGSALGNVANGAGQCAVPIAISDYSSFKYSAARRSAFSLSLPAMKESGEVSFERSLRCYDDRIGWHLAGPSQTGFFKRQRSRAGESIGDQPLQNQGAEFFALRWFRWRAV